MANERVSKEQIYDIASDVCDKVGNHHKDAFNAIVWGLEEVIDQALRSPHQGAVEPVGYVSEQTVKTLRHLSGQSNSFGQIFAGSREYWNDIPLYLQPSVPKAGEEIEELRDMSNEWFEQAKKNGKRIEAAERENKALRKALDEIRELNLENEDENGHRWANSDMINQTIVSVLAELEAS